MSDRGQHERRPITFPDKAIDPTYWILAKNPLPPKSEPLSDESPDSAQRLEFAAEETIARFPLSNSEITLMRPGITKLVDFATQLHPDPQDPTAAIGAIDVSATILHLEEARPDQSGQETQMSVFSKMAETAAEAITSQTTIDDKTYDALKNQAIASLTQLAKAHPDVAKNEEVEKVLKNQAGFAQKKIDELKHIVETFNTHFTQLVELNHLFEDNPQTDLSAWITARREDLSKYLLQLLLLKQPLIDIEKAQDNFFRDRRGSPLPMQDRPVSEADPILARSEAASFAIYGKCDSETLYAYEGNERAPNIRETVSWVVGGLARMAADDIAAYKKDSGKGNFFRMIKRLRSSELHNKLEAKIKAKREEELIVKDDLRIVIFDRDHFTEVVIPHGVVPKLGDIYKVTDFLDQPVSPELQMSNDQKIQIRRFAYNTKSKSERLQNLKKAHFRIVLSRDVDPEVAEADRRYKLHGVDSQFITMGRNHRAAIHLGFKQNNELGNIDIKYAHPYFNGSDAKKFYLDLGMYIQTYSQRTTSEPDKSTQLQVKSLNLNHELAKVEGATETQIFLLPLETFAWADMPASQVNDLNQRIGVLKPFKTTIGSVLSFAQIIASGEDSLHRIYHSMRTDNLDLAIAALKPEKYQALFQQWQASENQTLWVREHTSELLELQGYMKPLMEWHEKEGAAAADNRSVVSFMAGVAGNLEAIVAPTSGFLVPRLKKWVQRPASMFSPLLDGFDKTKNDSANAKEVERINKKFGSHLEHVTQLFARVVGFDTAQSASYQNDYSFGVAGATHTYDMAKVDPEALSETAQAKNIALSERTTLVQMKQSVRQGIVEKYQVKAGFEERFNRSFDQLFETLSDPATSNEKAKQAYSAAQRYLQTSITIEDLHKTIGEEIQKIPEQRIQTVVSAAEFVMVVLEAKKVVD